MLRVALSHAMYYYEVLNSVEFAMKTVAEAIAEAKDEFYNYKRKCEKEKQIKEYHDCLRTLDANL